MNKRIGIAAVGDVTDIAAFSGTPYYFMKASHKAGWNSYGWEMDLSKVNFHRYIWNFAQVMRFKKKGGYQYSKDFATRISNQIPKEFFSDTIISLNQTFPRVTSILEYSGQIYYYIDCTLYDLFNEKAYEINISNSIIEKALAQEKENYDRALALVCMGSWVKNSLINYYQIPDSKIFTILPGANLELPYNFIWKDPEGNPGITRDLILGFVGKDWRRKGLPILIDICNVLKNKGYKLKIKAIGNCPDELKNLDCIEYSGFIDKQTESDKFIQNISSCDIGCLFSSSEALGISTLEFIRVGVPVAGFYHQGLKDTLFEGASFRFNFNNSISEIAEEIEKFILNKNLRENMKLKAREYSSFVTWDRCIGEWGKILEK
jgi:glycosyltransferase involved in cell wall biosynthesis